MAQFPYTAQGGFETGALDSGFALTDTQSKSLGYLHYTTTAVKYNMLPFRGAYCWGIDQSVDSTTDVNLTVAAMNVADNSYWTVSGAFYLKNITMAAAARVSLVKNIAAATEEGVMQLYYTAAGGLQILLTQAYNTAVGSNPVCGITQNAWHTFEMYGWNDAQGAGTLYLILDDIAMGSVTSLTNAAITDTKIGSMDAGASEFTVGNIFFDDIYCHVDTAAIRMGHRSRYPTNPHISAIASVTYKEHLFLGPGTVREATVLTAAAGDILRLYDTDRAYDTGSYNLVAEANFSSGMPYISGPIAFERGCFAVLIPGGAAGARAMVQVDLAPPCGYPKPMYYGYPANLKKYAIHQRNEIHGNL
jgi:hypothetical protein